MGVLLAGAGTGAFWLVDWVTHGRFEEKTNDAYLQADQVVIAPRIGGYVTEVLVGDNQNVKPGQPLVRIDPRTVQATVDQTRTTIAARQADLDKASADLGRQSAVIEQARAQRDVAAAQARFATADLARYRQLADNGADTVQKREQARSTAEQAAGTLVAQNAALTAAERQLVSLRAMVDQSRATVGSAQAQAASAKVDLQSAVITSAIAGRVGDRSVRVGQFVQPGTRLMSVAPIDQLYVTANFKETQVGRMKIGQAVIVKIDALPGQEIKGAIDSFAPGTGAQFALLPPQNATGNFTKIVQRVPVRIAIHPSPEVRAHLLPGLSSEVIVDTRGADHGN